jgi:DNA-directed RNA polymerase III subunit RPC3
VLRAYVGEQAAYVYSCLHSQRKQTLQQLAEKSGIKGANLKKILVTLIQLGCVVYTTNERSGQIFYCHNEEGCWKLTYVDEIVRHVRLKFGHDHASVIQNIILRGHLTIGSYVKEIELRSEVEKIEQAFIDLIEDKWIVHVKDLDFRPLNESFSECIRLANREFLNNSNQYVKSNDDMGGSSGNSGNPRFKNAGLSQLKKTIIIKDLAKEKFMKLYFDNSGKDKLHKVGIRNQLDDETLNAIDVAKGVSTLFSDDDDDDGDGNIDVNSKIQRSTFLRRLNGNVPLTVSFERFLKYERDIQLVSISKHRIGNVTAMIYKVVLNRIEKSSRDVRSIENIVDKLVADASVGVGSAGSSTSGYDPTVGQDLLKRLELRDQQKGLNFGAADILKELSISNKYELTKDDLLGTINNDDDEEYEKNSRKRKLEEDKANGTYKKSKLSKLATEIKTFDEEEDENEGDIEVDNGFDLNNNSENNELMMLILQHLKLLTTDNKISFLIETTPGQFYVPFTVLQTQLPFYHMKQIIKSVLGNSALRILNCIENKRLIEEKNIAKSVLMREGDVRKIIATLTKFGLVEIQEIPRTADRSAMRGIFAFKPNKNFLRGKTILAKCLMFNMGEVLDQIEQMKKDNRILLDKISRDDVRGHEGELLLESELSQLKKVVESEKIGMAKFQRLRALGEVLWFFNTV